MVRITYQQDKATCQAFTKRQTNLGSFITASPLTSYHKAASTHHFTIRKLFCETAKRNPKSTFSISSIRIWGAFFHSFILSISSLSEKNLVCVPRKSMQLWFPFLQFFFFWVFCWKIRRSVKFLAPICFLDQRSTYLMRFSRFFFKKKNSDFLFTWDLVEIGNDSSLNHVIWCLNFAVEMVQLGMREW